MATIEKFVFGRLGVLRGAAIRIAIVKWKSFRRQKVFHKALDVSE